MQVNHFDELDKIFDGAEMLTDEEFDEIWEEGWIEPFEPEYEQQDVDERHGIIATLVNYFCALDDMPVEDLVEIEDVMPEGITVLGVLEFVKDGLAELEKKVLAHILVI